MLDFHNLVVSFKEELHNILSFYFDGGTHEIADLAIDFPEAKIVYSIQDLNRPNNLVIAFIFSSEIDRQEEKCHNPNNLSLPGVELRSNILATAYMATPIQGGENTKNLLSLETYWGNLGALFSQYSIFSEVGIIAPRLQTIPSPSVSRSDIAEVSGSFSCQLRAQFARYNT